MMSKEHVLKHIKAARLWLDRAQTFVEDNNIVRGLSFLFLASAETQMPLRESHKARQADKKEKAEKIFHLKPSYRFAMAAGLSFVIAFAGWEMLFKERYNAFTAPHVNVQRISASEFVNKLKESNEREENKVFSMIENALNTLKNIKDTNTASTEQTLKWVAYRTPRKVKPYKKRALPVVNETMTAAAPVENVTPPEEIKQPFENTAGVNNSPSVTSDEDLLGLVKIAEKTLKGQ